MSGKKYCANCGGELVTGARFCRFCGHPADPSTAPPPKRQSSRQIIPPSQRESSSPEASSPTPRKRTGFQIRQPTPNPIPSRIVPPSPIETPSFSAIQETEVPEEVINILWGRIRAGQINRALKDLVKDVETIEKKHEIGLIDAEDAQEQLSATTEKMNDLKAERQELVLDQKIKIEQVFKELEEAKDRLTKLEEMKREGKIERQSVYDKLKIEYSEKYEKMKTEIREEGIRSSQWIQILSKEVKSLEDALESIKVRVELDEIPENDAETQKTEKEYRLNKCKSCIQVLEALISEVRAKGIQI